MKSRTKSRARLAGLAVLGLAALTVVPFVACTSLEPGLVGGRLQACPSSPNCVTSEGEAEDAAAYIEPFELEGDPESAFAALLTLVAETPRAEVREVTADYARAVFRSAVLRFADDVEFRLDAAHGLIHVRSASRVGYSDLGVNRRRVEALRESWRRLAED